MNIDNNIKQWAKIICEEKHNESMDSSEQREYLLNQIDELVKKNPSEASKLIGYMMPYLNGDFFDEFGDDSELCDKLYGYWHDVNSNQSMN